MQECSLNIERLERSADQPSYDVLSANKMLILAESDLPILKQAEAEYAKLP